MFSLEARQQLLSADANDDAPKAMLVEWTDSRVTLPESLTRRERVRLLQEHFGALKEPLLTELRSAGVTVEDLPASPQFIARATPAKWRDLLMSSGLVSDPRVEVLPNVTFYTQEQDKAK